MMQYHNNRVRHCAKRISGVLCVSLCRNCWQITIHTSHLKPQRLVQLLQSNVQGDVWPPRSATSSGGVLGGVHTPTLNPAPAPERMWSGAQRPLGPERHTATAAVTDLLSDYTPATIAFALTVVAANWGGGWIRHVATTASGEGDSSSSSGRIGWDPWPAIQDAADGSGPDNATRGGDARLGGEDVDVDDARSSAERDGKSEAALYAPSDLPDAGEVDSGGDVDPQPSLGVRAALALLGFYRGVMSPLMPSTCRFLPSCSAYSVDSYKRFGLSRGTVLTAWRLLRCNPWGGCGYDPPAWPPVGLGAIYSLPYSPEISLVVGLAAGYWLVASTLESLIR